MTHSILTRISEGTEPAPRAGMSSTLRHVRVLLPVVAALAATACGGGDVVLPSEGVAAKILVVSGNNQAGVVGATLVDSLIVRVTDSKDRPVQNQQVTFSPGNAASGQAVPPTAMTNADGRAGVKWVLGTVAGAQTMVAKPTGNSAPASLSASFAATAATSAVAKLEKTAGDGQTATAGSAVSTAPAVKATDADGNPVAGVGVTFAVATGGGSVNPTTPVATNAAGIAAATSWTLGTVAGANTLTATISGVGITGNPATFTATGRVGSAGKLAITQQPSATAQSGVAFAQQPKLQLEDAGGNPVATGGIAVTAAIASGTGGTLGGQLTVATDNTGAATFTNLSISGPSGAYTISFSNPNVTGVTSATVTLAAGSPAKLAITVEPPASAQSGAVLNPPPEIQAEDGQGNPVAQAGIAVTASLNVPGGASGTLGGTKTVATDGTGKATFTNLVISGSNGGYTLSFSAPSIPQVTSTTIAIGAGVATKLAFTQQPSNVAAGAAISPAVEVSIEDGSGNVVTGATDQVTIAISNNPGGGTLSGTLSVAAVAGVASFSNLSINKSGNGYTLVATSGSLTQATSGGFNVHAGPANQIAANSAQSQSATVGTAVPADPSVVVRDANGNPVQGVAVTFAVTTGGGTVSPTSPINTNASGIATVNSWTLGPNPGANQLTATVNGLSGSPVVFNASGTAALSISTGSPLPSGQVGVSYSSTLTPAGGSAPYTWAVQSGSLPAGLGLDANTGTISGTPTAAAAPASFVIQLTDATTASVTKGFQLTVAKGTTTTTITNVAPEPSNVGSPITVTVSVTAAIGTPTGPVTVDDGSFIPATCTIPDISTSNSCSLTPNGLLPGTITLTATYAGDGNYAGSSGTSSHTLQ